MIITQTRYGYQLQTNSGKMYAIEPTGTGYKSKPIPKQPMVGILVHGIPNKIKRICFELNKNIYSQ